MKMAAARPPQSVFTADVYLSYNTSNAPALAFAQDVRVAGWTKVGDWAGRKNGSGTYVIYECMITTKEVRLCLCYLRLTCLAGRIENNDAYFETALVRLPNAVQYSLLPSSPTLPPKATLARFRPAFLDGRGRASYGLGY